MGVAFELSIKWKVFFVVHYEETEHDGYLQEDRKKICVLLKYFFKL